MTNIQAQRERANLESQDRRASLEETKRDNKRKRAIEQQDANTRYQDMNTRSRAQSVEESLAPYRKAESVTKAISNSGKAFKDIMAGVTAPASLAGGGGVFEYNDWTWYVASAERMNDIANLPMFTPYGSEFDFADGETTIDTTAAAPGILAIETAQTVGYAQGADSALQKAAESFYDKVNSRTGRNTDYEAVDLLMLTLAFASLDAYSAHLKRAYRIANTTSPFNDYIPRHFVELMGIDYDDMIANKTAFRDHINYLEDMKFKYLSIPGLPIRERWIYEYTHIFASSTDGAMQQYYLYIPRHFFKLNLGSAQATSLEEVLWINPSTNYLDRKKLTDIRSFTSELLSGFANLSDAKMMKADIENAYGDAAKYIKQYIKEDEGEFHFAIDPLSLTQFQNATLLHKDVTDDSVAENNYRISQDSTGYIFSRPVGKATDHSQFIKRTPILCSGISRMSKEQRQVLAIEATRLMQMPETYESPEMESTLWALRGPAASVANRMYIICAMSRPNNSESGPRYKRTIETIDLTELTVWGDDNLTPGRYAILTLANSFKFFPKTFFRATIDYNLEEHVDSILPIFDWDQALVIDNQQLDNMNRTIALHLFGGDIRF